MPPMNIPGVGNEEDEDEEFGDDNSMGSNLEGGKKKQKRRSKNDVQGRDFKCTFCDKTYLSYPALYTHMKNKHAKGPDGQPLIAFNSGRGRGRPKKNQIGCRSHVEPTNNDFFRTIEKVGGPVEPTYGFSEVYTEIFIKKKVRMVVKLQETDENFQNADEDDGEDNDEEEKVRQDDEEEEEPEDKHKIKKEQDELAEDDELKSEQGDDSEMKQDTKQPEDKAEDGSKVLESPALQNQGSIELNPI